MMASAGQRTAIRSVLGNGEIAAVTTVSVEKGLAFALLPNVNPELVSRLLCQGLFLGSLGPLLMAPVAEAMATPVMSCLALAVVRTMSAVLTSRIVVPDGKLAHGNVHALTDIFSQPAARHLQRSLPHEYQCIGSSYGDCCSAYGYCESNTTYCEAGCQSKFGACLAGGAPILVFDPKTGGICSVCLLINSLLTKTIEYELPGKASRK